MPAPSIPNLATISSLRKKYYRSNYIAFKAGEDFNKKLHNARLIRSKAGVGSQEERAVKALMDTESQPLKQAEDKRSFFRQHLSNQVKQLWKEETPADPKGSEFSFLDSSIPVVLLPVRLETRFFLQNGKHYLLIRIYPDSIHIDTHRKELLPDEKIDGETYWETAKDAASELSAWRGLCSKYTVQRASWIVRVTKKGRGFDEKSSDSSTGRWIGRPEANALPDRWIAVCEREVGRPLFASSEAISESLAVSSAPGMDKHYNPGSIIQMASGTITDPESLWLIDFEEAKSRGMGIKVEISAGDYRNGFTRVIVFGAKASLSPEESSKLLSELIESHAYTRGADVIRQGTPTNNSKLGQSGFAGEGTPDAHVVGDRHPARERQEIPKVFTDTAAITRSLGLDSDLASVFPSHVSPSEVKAFEEQKNPFITEKMVAQAMNDAIWPATLGYFLDQLGQPYFSGMAIAEARLFFKEWVLGRGHIPALRIGKTPYGIIPVSSVKNWKANPYEAPFRISGRTLPFESALPELLNLFWDVWHREVNEVPRIGKTEDPNADLLSVLAMDASSRGVEVRLSHGQEAWYNILYKIFNNSQLAIDNEVKKFIDQMKLKMKKPGLNFAAMGFSYEILTKTFKFPLVTSDPLSETENLEWNYIDWFLQKKPYLDYWNERISGSEKPKEFLYILLRHAFLTEMARISINPGPPGRQIKAPKAYDAKLESFLAPNPTKLTPLLELLTEENNKRLSEIDTAINKYSPYAFSASDIGNINTYLNNFHLLKDVPTAELQRALTESLDLFSHRYDAWLTGMYARRLKLLRKDNPSGLSEAGRVPSSPDRSYLGAYGWVENLIPKSAAPAKVKNGGFIHAPSMNHAMAGAVLRNGYLSKGKENTDAYGIDLSSARVRGALELINFVRQGQPLANVLGYFFEAGLHEQQLDSYISIFRAAFPIDNATNPSSSEVDAAVEGGVFGPVVDGLKLLKKWGEYLSENLSAANANFKSNYLDRVIKPSSIDHANKLLSEINALHGRLDALTDLCTSESIYQMVVGNYAAVSSLFEGLTQGKPLSEPQIAKTPRSGMLIHQRAGILLPKDVGNVSDQWPPSADSQRGQVERSLDIWCGNTLPDPKRIKWKVVWTHSKKTEDWTAEKLGLRPLDFVSLSRNPGVFESYLLSRALDFALDGSDIPTLDLSRYEDKDQVVTFPEAVEMGRAIANLLHKSEAMTPEHLSLVGDTPTISPLNDLRLFELKERAMRFRNSLSSGETKIAVLRENLRKCVLWGLNGALGDPTNDIPALQGRIDLAKQELSDRMTAADEESDNSKAFKVLLGSDHPHLTPFKMLQTPKIEAWAKKLGGNQQLLKNHARDMQAWLVQNATVHEKIELLRKTILYSRALKTSQPRLEAFQGARGDNNSWVRHSSHGTNPYPGTVSLVLCRPYETELTDEVCGLIFDEWNEVIPSKEETTGLSFHYDAPGSEAPQAILVAVAPDLNVPTWSMDTLWEILKETFDLAKMRGVDHSLLSEWGQFMPATLMAVDPDNQTVSTDFKDSLLSPVFLAYVNTIGEIEGKVYDNFME